MELYIYWFGHAHASRYDVEDTIDEVLAGKGQVTGGGSGDTGGNIDIEIDDDADVERLMGQVARAVSADLPAYACYQHADDEEQHLLRELLPEHPRAPEHLRAAGEGIRSGLNSALEAAAPGGRLPFRCAASMVDGATVISQLVGRLSVEDARERLGRWAAGEASFMIRKPLELVGATAWEAHYNGVPVLRVPV
ncbi:hypothetical protein [Nonomuraea sp. NPDC049709]|uniref:hypothetical protein n=1 Tax=Nonomuraea sp. NPDC049709 TaxID=3154736 RepID=UPI00342B634E